MFAILQTWLCKSPSIFEISLQHRVWTPCKDISFEEQQKQGSSVEGDHEELKVTQAQAVSSPTLAVSQSLGWAGSFGCGKRMDQGCPGKQGRARNKATA